MLTLNNYNIGFLTHIIIESPAAFNFFVFPSKQLGTHTPHAHAVIRQYAVLILTSNLVALSFVCRPMDELSGKIAGALALYHIAPSVRSIIRLKRQAREGRTLMPSEAFLYLVVHAICGAALLLHFWDGMCSNLGF
ncbi:uncharacterized protein A1O9_04391 [Exophiala aquamarina CBS 119918]|uniref:Amino acid transporter transmembrane domain-containing protein n=1 Tax=Exophiala aquamarina CBS 119918 TaxID=1182545 RepID=A0A072PIG3_9EURO|nr:uncharacterized protein A1O9_04391 [Exophiala aquamarina CBS 119918]KEF59547.1 hypothetical protein A1O9_04391 [Exophiala aquamarina CBS 119918]